MCTLPHFEDEMVFPAIKYLSPMYSLPEFPSQYHIADIFHDNQIQKFSFNKELEEMQPLNSLVMQSGPVLEIKRVEKQVYEVYKSLKKGREKLDLIMNEIHDGGEQVDNRIAVAETSKKSRWWRRTRSRSGKDKVETADQFDEENQVMEEGPTKLLGPSVILKPKEKLSKKALLKLAQKNAQRFKQAEKDLNNVIQILNSLDTVLALKDFVRLITNRNLNNNEYDQLADQVRSVRKILDNMRRYQNDLLKVAELFDELSQTYLKHLTDQTQFQAPVTAIAA